MADAKITALDALTAQAATDILAIVDDVAGTPVTKKITIANLFQGIPCNVGIGGAPAHELDIIVPNATTDVKLALTQIGAIGWAMGLTVTTGDFKLEIDGGQTAMDVVRSGANIASVVFPNGKVGVGVTPASKLHVDQASETGAIPVLALDQADIDLEFIKLIGSSQNGQADRSLCDVADLANAGALVGWFQIYVEDVQATNPITDGVYYVPFYAAPSA